MPLHDFSCPDCGTVFEEVVPAGTPTQECPECGKTAEKVYTKAPPTLTAIIPDYPGCKKQRAGYVHSHGDMPATKTQVQGCSFGKP